MAVEITDPVIKEVFIIMSENGKADSSLRHIRTLTSVALLTALSVVIGILCKNFFTFNVYYRVTFENMPILLAGILYGPAAGAVCGALADVISCLCSTNPAVIPLITVGAATVGLCAGLVSKFFIKKHGPLQYFIASLTGHLLGQVAIKSIAKILFLGMPSFGIAIGLGISVVVGTLEFLAISLIMKKGIVPGISTETGGGKDK